MTYNTKNVRAKAARDAIPPKREPIPKADLLRRLRAERKAAGLVSARFDVTPDEKRKLQICLDRLRRLRNKAKA